MGNSSNRIKVLMYHRIVTDRKLVDAHWTCVHVEDFRQQIRMLDRWGFTGIRFSDHRLSQYGKVLLPRRPVIITFDDGYVDVIEHALPVLKEFGMAAVAFVLGDRSITTNVWDLVDGIPSASLLSEHQITLLQRSGIEIGSHSMTHAKLPSLDDEELWDEVVQSKLILEELTGEPIQSFSYPYGLVDSRIKHVVNKAGYRFACGVYSGPPMFGSDWLELRRITISNQSRLAGFAMKMLTPYEYGDWLRSAFGRTMDQALENIRSTMFRRKMFNSRTTASRVANHQG